MLFYEKLREIRDANKLSQADFAKKLETTRATIIRYEQNERVPSIHFIEKFIQNFNINPNWLFFNQEPILRDEELRLSIDNINLLNDLSIILSQKQITEKLTLLLLDELIRKIDIDEYSKPSKFLELLKLDDSKKARPFLFLYYIFQTIVTDDKNMIENYKQYVTEKISDYKVISFKNKPFFDEQIKKEIAAYIELNFTEEECKALILNANTTVKVLESMMPPSMLLSHRKNI